MKPETWIGHAPKRRPYWEGQARMIPSMIYMISFRAFLKQKTVKRTLLQTDNILSPQMKKHPALPGRKNFRNFRERENQIWHLWYIKLFIKKKHVFSIQNNIFFKFQFAVLKDCHTFDSNSLPFVPSCSLQPTNNCFCATESDIDLQTILHPLWTIGFSNVTYIKLWWSAKDLQKYTLKI